MVEKHRPIIEELDNDELAAVRKLAEREYMKDYGYLAEGATTDPEKEKNMHFWDQVFVKLGGESHYGSNEYASPKVD